MNFEYTNENCPDENNQIYSHCITALACFLNGLLFYLITTDTHPLLQPYKICLYTSTTLDFTSSLIQWATQVRPALLGSKKTLVMNLDGPLPRLVQNWSVFRDGNLNYLLIADWVACYMVVVYSVVPFVFRYLVIVVKNYRMSKLQFFCLLFFAFSYCFTISVAITSLSAATHFDNMASMPIANTSCTRFLPQFNANNINTPLREIQFRAWVYIGQVFQCLYVIIFFCMSSIWWFLRKQSALMSSQNKSIQFQISLTIGLQSLIPFVAYFGPVYVFSLTLDWGPYWQSIYYYLLFTSYSLVPFLNPLIPMLFVARYRQAIVGAFYSVVTKTPGMSNWGQSASVQTIDLTSGNHT